MSQRLDPCRFADIFARFDGVFERIGQGRILLGFHYEPSFIVIFIKYFENWFKINTPVSRNCKGPFSYSLQKTPFFIFYFFYYFRSCIF